MTKTKILTDFELDVLKATLKISLGQTRSYKWIAKEIGRPKAVRAVGQALNKNPFAPFVPCHRVIKEDGSIGGFAKGTKKKKFILDKEKYIAAQLRKEGSK